MSPKIGQKLKDNPKDKLVQIRMDEDTLRKLDYVVEKENSDRSKVIRTGIELQFYAHIEKK